LYHKECNECHGSRIERFLTTATSYPQSNATVILRLATAAGRVVDAAVGLDDVFCVLQDDDTCVEEVDDVEEDEEEKEDEDDDDDIVRWESSVGPPFLSSVSEMS
jgi:hypothetical protein